MALSAENIGFIFRDLSQNMWKLNVFDKAFVDHIMGIASEKSLTAEQEKRLDEIHSGVMDV